MTRVNSPSLGYDIFPWLPPGQEWRDEALCARHPEPWLWDAVLDETGESREARRTRHAIAIGVCERCPVRRQCEADIDHEHDEGVRAGVLLRDKFGVRRTAA